jgi:ParB family chromosome partitioning protein
LGDSPPAESPTELSLDAISPNLDQPRSTFDERELRELANSIATHGLLQPLVVQSDGDGYRIIAGERRFRAARLAGLSTVPAVVRATRGLEHLELALVENLQRADLNPVEEARGYRRLMEAGGRTQDQVAQRVGKSRVTITNALRLLKLPDDILASVERGELSAGHARALLAVTDDASRRELFDRILAEHLSVRATEDAAQQPLAPVPIEPGSATPPSPPPADPDLAALQQRLIEALGTKVDVRGSARRGRISVTYYSPDDLERICERITGMPTPDIQP